MDGRETRLGLSALDTLETGSDEPGVKSINIPSLGRRVFLRLEQEL